MSKTNDWRASLAEHRSAWLIASISLVLVLVAVLKPDLFHAPDNSGEASRPASTASKKTAAPLKANVPTFTAKPAAKPAPARQAAGGTKTAEAETKPAPGQAMQPLPRRTAPPAVRTDQAKAAKPTAPNPRAVKTDSGRKARVHEPLRSGSYYVQTGAFRDKSHAERLARRINGQGWNAKVVRKSGNLYAVWVGPRQTRSLARTLQESLKQRLNLQGFIVKKPS